MRAIGDGNGPLKNKIEYFIDRQPGVAGGELERSVALRKSRGRASQLHRSVVHTGHSQPYEHQRVCNASFSDIMFAQTTGIPEPATLMMSLMALGGVAFSARRDR